MKSGKSSTYSLSSICYALTIDLCPIAILNRNRLAAELRTMRDYIHVLTDEHAELMDAVHEQMPRRLEKI